MSWFESKTSKHLLALRLFIHQWFLNNVVHGKNLNRTSSTDRRRCIFAWKIEAIKVTLIFYASNQRVGNCEGPTFPRFAFRRDLPVSSWFTEKAGADQTQDQ